MDNSCVDAQINIVGFFEDFVCLFHTSIDRTEVKSALLLKSTQNRFSL